MLNQTESDGVATVHVCSCVCGAQLKRDTLAVQSFNVVLEFSPLEANAVGQLLTGVNTNQLHASFTGVKHSFVLLRLDLDQDNEQRRNISHEPRGCRLTLGTGVSPALSDLLPA